jgi:hypothetical protein
MVYTRRVNDPVSGNDWSNDAPMAGHVVAEDFGIFVKIAATFF